jgi:hypothetical protein
MGCPAAPVDWFAKARATPLACKKEIEVERGSRGPRPMLVLGLLVTSAPIS